jgi:pimeloyl-ACP methyl ester carboxylesterase
LDTVQEPFMNLAILGTVDGQNLRTYSSGSTENPAVALIVPIALPAGMLAETIRELSKTFFVVTWEARCCLTSDPFDTDTRVDVDVQGDDLLLILEHHELRRVHVIGWCTGAIVALKAAHRYPDVIGSLTLAMGTFGFTDSDGIVLSQYQIEINTFMPRVAADRRAAAVLHRLVFENVAFMETMQNEWSQWTRVGFSDPETLFRFANSAIRILDEDVRSFAGDVQTPTLVITSKGDRFAHPEHSRRVAGMLPRATLFEDDEGDHYSIAVPASASVREAVAFIRRELGAYSEAGGGV